MQVNMILMFECMLQEHHAISEVAMARVTAQVIPLERCVLLLVGLQGADVAVWNLGGPTGAFFNRVATDGLQGSIHEIL